MSEHFDVLYKSPEELKETLKKEEEAEGVLREKMAALCHEQWSNWMKYLLNLCRHDELGAAIIPTGLVDRWARQMRTPYTALSDKEKESDRAEADRFLKLLDDFFKEHFKDK